MWRTLPSIHDTCLGAPFLVRCPKPAGISDRCWRERGVLLPSVLRIAEGAGGIGFSICGRYVIGCSTRIGPNQFERLGPVVSLQRQFGTLLPEPHSAWMGGFSLLGDNQSLRPVVAINRLA